METEPYACAPGSTASAAPSQVGHQAGLQPLPLARAWFSGQTWPLPGLTRGPAGYTGGALDTLTPGRALPLICWVILGWLPYLSVPNFASVIEDNSPCPHTICCVVRCGKCVGPE